jgi:hypothetical protein
MTTIIIFANRARGIEREGEEEEEEEEEERGRVGGQGSKIICG